MNKKNNLAIFALLVVGLFSLFSLNSLSQEATVSETKQSQKVNAENGVLQNYINISSLSMNERKKFFSNLSAKEKANLFKLHLALQFVKRPNLAKNQSDLILESISIATPDAYDKNNPEKLEKSWQGGEMIGQNAKALFSQQEFFEIFAAPGGETTEINLLQKYQEISALSALEMKETFKKFSAKDKSDLWRVHLALNLAKQSELNSRQRGIILEIIAFATPELYELARDSSEWTVKMKATVQLFTSRALEAFSKDKIAEIFINFGGKNPCLRDSIAGEGVKLADDLLCNCSRQWADCPQPLYCMGTCLVPPGGGECGFMGWYICNGKCLEDSGGSKFMKVEN